jgi:hypothetical protein
MEIIHAHARGWNKLAFVAFVACKLKQTDMAGAFNCTGQGALVFGASTGLAAWADLPFFRYETAQNVRLFIINRQVFIGTELADLWAGIITAFAALFHIIIVV